MNNVTKASIFLFIFLLVKLVLLPGYEAIWNILLGMVVIPINLAVTLAFLDKGAIKGKAMGGLLALALMEILELFAYFVHTGNNSFLEPGSRAVAIAAWLVAATVFTISLHRMEARRRAVT